MTEKSSQVSHGGTKILDLQSNPEEKSNVVVSPHLSSCYMREHGNKAPRPAEGNRRPRNKSPHFVSYIIRAKTSIEKRQYLHGTVLEKLGTPV